MTVLRLIETKRENGMDQRMKSLEQNKGGKRVLGVERIQERWRPRQGEEYKNFAFQFKTVMKSEIKESCGMDEKDAKTSASRKRCEGAL